MAPSHAPHEIERLIDGFAQRTPMRLLRERQAALGGFIARALRKRDIVAGLQHHANKARAEVFGEVEMRRDLAQARRCVGGVRGERDVAHHH